MEKEKKVNEMQRKLHGKLQELSGHNPNRVRGKLSEREIAWRKHLEKLPKDGRAALIAERRRYAVKRREVMGKLRKAVNKTIEKFDDFKGVLVSGSFAEGKQVYNDINLIIVVSHYKPTAETHLMITKIEQEMHRHMPPSARKESTRYRSTHSFAHFDMGVVIMDNPESIAEWAKKVRLWNFIGDKETEKKLLSFVNKK